MNDREAEYAVAKALHPFVCGSIDLPVPECLRRARATLTYAWRPDYGPDGLPETSLPERVVVGANGAYWRDYGAHYSMCPVSDDNDPVEIRAVYVREAAAPRPEGLRDEAGRSAEWYAGYNAAMRDYDKRVARP